MPIKRSRRNSRSGSGAVGNKIKMSTSELGASSARPKPPTATSVSVAGRLHSRQALASVRSARRARARVSPSTLPVRWKRASSSALAVRNSERMIAVAFVALEFAEAAGGAQTGGFETRLLIGCGADQAVEAVVPSIAGRAGVPAETVSTS